MPATLNDMLISGQALSYVKQLVFNDFIKQKDSYKVLSLKEFDSVKRIGLCSVKRCFNGCQFALYLASCKIPRHKVNRRYYKVCVCPQHAKEFSSPDIFSEGVFTWI